MNWAKPWQGAVGYWRERSPIRGDFLAVLNWHQVTPSFDPRRHHRYTWTQLGDFEASLDWLAQKFEILPLTEAIDRCRRRAIQGPCAALTFDDGDVSIAEYVAPVLVRRQLPATFFINSAYLNQSRSYWFPILAFGGDGLPADLRAQAQNLRQTNDAVFYQEVRQRVEQLAATVPDLASRLVSSEWLAGLDARQFTIGAHGHEHQRFSLMTRESQRSNLRENVRCLSQFRAYRPVFAVPFGRPGDWNASTLEVARELGLDVVLADGGLNFRPAEAYRRISCDGQAAGPLIRQALSRA